MRSRLFTSATALFLCKVATVVAQGLQTITVDDADISIAYVTDPTIPSSRWTAVDVKNGINTTCNAAVHCFSGNLDTNQVKDGTWHEGSDIASATYRFTGVAVDVYFVYRNVQGDVTNVTFLLDGQVRGDMIQAGNADEWEYNYHAFGANSLTNDEHTLTIQGGTPNLFILDYLTYQKVIPAPTTSSAIASVSDTASSTSATSSGTAAADNGSKSNGGAIAGGIIGGLAVVAAGILGIWFYLRRQREKNRAEVDLTPPATRTSFGPHVNTIPTAYTSQPGESTYSPYTPYSANSPQMQQNFPVGRHSLASNSQTALPGMGSGTSSSPSDPSGAPYGAAALAVNNPENDAYHGAPPPSYEAAGGSGASPRPPIKTARS